MKMSLESSNPETVIKGYGVDYVRVGEEVYRHSLVVTSERIIGRWRPRQLIEVEYDDTKLLAGLDVEIVLLGTGNKLRFLPAEITAPIINSGKGLETMDNGAACRTYNILATEGRKVAIALLIGGENEPD